MFVVPSGYETWAPILYDRHRLNVFQNKLLGRIFGNRIEGSRSQCPSRSKASTVIDLSNTGTVGSNPTQDMNICVCLFCICVVLCVGSSLATGWFPVQGVLPSVCRIKNLKKSDQVPKGRRAIERERENRRKWKSLDVNQPKFRGKSCPTVHPLQLCYQQSRNKWKKTTDWDSVSYYGPMGVLRCKIHIWIQKIKVVAGIRRKLYK
jgi:hypothetical protein